MNQTTGDESLVFESPVDFHVPSTSANLAGRLLESFKKHSDKILMVDSRSKREWTGSKLLDHCGRIATCLHRQANLGVNDVVMTMCDRDDSEVLVALSVILAGAALYPTMPTDGYNEAALLCELVRPQTMIINRQYHEVAMKLKRQVAGMSDTKIIWIDSLSLDLHLTNGHSRVVPEENGHNENGANVSDLDGPLEANRTIEESESNAAIGQAVKEESEAIEIDLNCIEQTHPIDTKLIESIANDQIVSQKHFAYYLLTSGSTGRPKVVPTSHYEGVCMLQTMICATTNPFRNQKMANAKVAVDENNNQIQEEPDECLLPLGESDVIAGDLPLDHGAGLNFMFLALVLGAKYIVMPSFDLDIFWRAVGDFQITCSISSTSFCFQLLSRIKKLADESRKDLIERDLSSLRLISSCGAKLTFVELVNEIIELLPKLVITQTYGCTECGYISSMPQRDALKHLDSVGFLFPGLRAKIVDPNTGELCNRGQRGELYVWSRALFKGYCCHPEVDAQEIYKNCHDERGEFYRTGDQAHLDDEGRLYIHGRYKDTLTLMGEWKIMPAELEDIVNQHPLVESSAVVGLPDPKLFGCHQPRAFVKLVRQLSDAQLSLVDSKLLAKWRANDLEFIANDIYKFAADRTAPAKHLTGGVRILDDFPRNGLLRKIDRKALRALD